MEFVSKQFPNKTVIYKGRQMKFVNGIYSTEDIDEIQYLQEQNYRVGGAKAVDTYTEPEKVICTEPSTGKHNIPVRWTVEKIREYAKTNGIVLPDGIETKRELTEYIENL